MMPSMNTSMTIFSLGGTAAPDSEEIEELRWVTPAQLTEELRTTPERFAPWFLTAAPMVLRFLE